jgi:PAS domain S-box-containing protein
MFEHPDSRKASVATVGERFELFFRTSPDLLCIIGDDGRFLDLNPAWERVLGHSRDLLLSQPCTSFIHPDDVAQTVEAAKSLSREALSSFENRYRCSDGSYRWLSWNASTWSDGLTYAVARDVTDQRMADQRFRALLGCASGAVFELDGEGRYLNIWASDEQLLARPAAELRGRKMDEVLPAEGAKHFLERIQRVLSTGAKEGFDYSLEVRGGRRWFWGDVVPLPAVGGKPATVAFMVRDITEQKDMEMRLLISDRMASVGMLAAGVAHEINNPLAYVTSNLAHLVEQLPELGSKLSPAKMSELTEVLAETQHGAERIRLIVRDLQTFSRESTTEEAGSVKVHAALDQSINMAWNHIRHRARLVKQFEPVPTVRGTDSRLEQVFLNLLMNAAQAIEEGNVEANEILVRTSCAPDGRVVVEIRDSGKGIPSDVLSRLFTPFFTTKPTGEGTGLGLSICHRIVSSFGGELRVESTVGKGSAFFVYLNPDTKERSAPAPVAAPLSAHARSRVLVVDDEPKIIASIRRVLGTEFEVVGTTRPRRGLELIARGERFDVILCDLSMPDMTGMEFGAALSDISPEDVPRLVFVTGGAFTPSAQSFLEQARPRCMLKPFHPDELRAAVREQIQRTAD